MAIVTSLLVKYRGGFVTVVSANRTVVGRREGFLSLDVSTADQAIVLATQVLAGVAVEVFEGQVEVVPDPSDATSVPGSGWQLGDRINIPNSGLTGSEWKQVVGLSVASGDENGTLTFVPELGKFNDAAEQRLQRAVRRMVLGTLNGDSDAAVATRTREITAKKHQPKPDPITFSWGGAVQVNVTPRWYIRSPVVTKLVTISLGTAGSSNTVAVVRKNGSTWATLTLTSGLNKATVAVLDRLVKDDYFDLSITTAGTGAVDLTVQIDMAEESEPPTADTGMI